MNYTHGATMQVAVSIGIMVWQQMGMTSYWMSQVHCSDDSDCDYDDYDWMMLEMVSVCVLVMYKWVVTSYC